jgi:hypothetical protein
MGMPRCGDGDGDGDGHTVDEADLLARAVVAIETQQGCGLGVTIRGRHRADVRI